MTVQLYDPLTYDNLMLGCVHHFESRAQERLDVAGGSVDGPGIYAIYYVGDSRHYQRIADGVRPICVGKAVPSGTRKGGVVNT